MMDRLTKSKPNFSKALTNYHDVNSNNKTQIEGVSLDVPDLGLRERDDQIDSLILAWFLLIYRGSLEPSSDLSWGVSSFSRDDEAPIQQITAGVNDVINSGEDSIADKLETIRKLRGKDETICSSLIFAALHDTDDNWAFSIGLRVVDSRLDLYLLERPFALSQRLATCHLLAFVDILHFILSNRDKTVAQAIGVGEGDLAEIWRWNCTVPPAINQCIHDIFIEKAREHSDRPAVTSWDGELTYGEVERYSTQLAVHIAGRGVNVGKAVLLCFEKSMWTVVAVLAVMKAGGALVLTDPSQPEARIETIATESKACLVLTSRKQAELGTRVAPGVKVLPVERDTFGGDKLDSSAILSPVPPSATLYIIFTSGSTGKPKGVVISHSNYTSGAIPRAEAVGYGPHSRVLDFPSYAFDVSIDCMLCTLAQGGCICVPSEEARINNLSGAIRDMKVNMAHMTPSVARVLEPDILPSLEVLGLGGESVSASDAGVWGQETKIIIAYGPSECTVGCTINNEVGSGRTHTSIGKGVGGSTWIVDPVDHNRLRPVGAVGELFIEGPIVGVGYLNEPEKTAEVFIEDPTWLQLGNIGTLGRKGRLYKTGDLVRYDPDGSGSIIFMGRADQQVKLRGQRVELGEIEHHLRNELPPATRVAVEVITPGGKAGEPTLVAFIAEENKGPQKPNGTEKVASFSVELTQALEKMDETLSVVLPRYMVPAAYIPLHEMPQLVSCKTDRKQLRSIGASLSRQMLANLKVVSAKKAKPQSEAEHKIHRLWNKLFGVDVDIGTGDNFFAMGGDSLRAMKLVVIAREEGLGLTVADIFKFPTMADMALALTQVDTEECQREIPEFSLINDDWKAETARAEAANICEIDSSLVEDVYPCTPLQEGLMALSAKVTEAYVAQRVVKLPDLTTAQNLQAAFEVAIAESTILRTRIVQVSRRGLMQVIVKGGISWNTNDSLEEYLSQDRDEPMGLGTRLARFALITDKKTDSVHIVLTIHHALYDGWSMPLVVGRINRAYRGLKTERPASFKAFIKYLNSTNSQESQSYWRNQLQGSNSLQFPVLPFSGYQAQAESLLEHYVPLERSSASSTSIANVIRGAWGIVAARYSGSNDVVFGETLTGRNAPIPGIEQIEGPMITTVPVRIRPNGKERVSDYLRNIHDQTVLRIPHEHMGLQHIRRLSPEAREVCELKTGIVIHPTTDEEEVGESSEDEPANGFVPAGDADAAREALKFNSYSLMLVFTVDTKGFLIMASFDSKTVDMIQMQAILEELGQTAQFLCDKAAAHLGDIDSSKNKDKTEQWRLSSIGPQSLTGISDKDLKVICTAATATWIVDSNNREHLVPAGAVGELLVECPLVTSPESLDIPDWLSSGTVGFPGIQPRLCTTNQLAKYMSDGNIILLGPKDERIDQSRVGGGHESGSSDETGLLKLKATSFKQQKMQELWSRVLGIDENDIGSSDSFFDLGGDSIGAMKLVSEARTEGMKLTVAKVFKHKRLCDMAEIVEGLHNTNEPEIVPYTPFSALKSIDVNTLLSTIQPKLSDPDWKIADILPTRPLQEIAVQGTVQLPRYSTRYELFYLDVAVEKSRLLKACQELISRNEILRTVFVKHEGQCLSVVLEQLRVAVVEYEIDSDLETFTKKLCEVDVQEQMPLGSSFVKFLFVQCLDGRTCLMMRISHAQYDEICLPVMLRQLSALYEGTSVPETRPFSSYVGHLVRDSIPQSIEYWRDLLLGSSMSIVRPDIPVQSTKHAAVYRNFNISARSKEVTVATLPTAVWALCLAKRLATKDVTFGEVVSGRNTGFANAEKVMGPCWQYVPVRVKFGPGWTGLDLLNYVQNQHVASARFEGIGLKEVVKHCTDWPESVDWFDTVVHQDVAHVESLPFLSASSRMETVYPHFEPLREWKIQAFLDGDNLGIEVVTVESWVDEAKVLLDEIAVVMEQLVNSPRSPIF